MPSPAIRPWRGALLALGTLLAACAEVPPPAPVTAPVPVATLEPEVADALRRMSATITGAQAFTLRFTTLREARRPDGQTILLGGTAAMAARRPDRLAASVGSDLGSFGLWYDGREFTVLNTHQNIYGSLPLTGPIDVALATVESHLGVTLPVLPLFTADPYAALTPAGTTGTRVGRSIVRDVVVDHYALNGPNGYWEIWLEAAPSALPMRVSYVEGGSDGLRVILEFQQWNLRARLPDQGFVFTPPRDAVRAPLRARADQLPAELSRRTSP